eukprot:6139279-Prymnesium_polylepis.2
MLNLRQQLEAKAKVDKMYRHKNPNFIEWPEVRLPRPTTPHPPFASRLGPVCKAWDCFLPFCHALLRRLRLRSQGPARARQGHRGVQ